LFEGGLEEVIHAKFNNLRRLRSIARKLKKGSRNAALERENLSR
jgi:hypothetical protein